jgi:hypothetical protein
MHSHVAKVVSEARLEEGPRDGVEGVAGRAEDVADNAWNMCRGRRGRRATLDGGLLLLALFAHFFAGRAGAGSAGGFAHDVVRDLVGFAFFGIAGIADGKLGLDETGTKKMLDSLVANIALEI